MRTLDKAELEKLSANASELDLNQLNVGDHIIASVGTYKGCIFLEDMRWVEGYVHSTETRKRLIRRKWWGWGVYANYRWVNLSSSPEHVGQPGRAELCIDDHDDSCCGHGRIL
ncbi:MAG: hypothetical protein KKE05_05960, partial [Nanoarchaeota archaeon]|nr:hypothetical protein [Nanoarchaeota archaeon]